MQSNQARAFDPDKRYRTLMIIWGAIFMNIVVLLVVANVIGPDQAKQPEYSQLDFSLGFLSTFVSLISVYVRHRAVKGAIERQCPQKIFGAYIVAFAMCEVGAICGMMERLLTNERRYYLLFIVAGLGMLLNMPRRDKLEEASIVKLM